MDDKGNVQPVYAEWIGGPALVNANRGEYEATYRYRLATATHSLDLAGRKAGIDFAAD